MTLGEKIAQYRKDNDLSIRAFARLSSLSPTFVSYLEKGMTQRGVAPVPTITTYQQCAKAMGMDVDELVREVSDVVSINDGNKKTAHKTVSGEDAEILDLFSKLSPDQKKVILAAAKGFVSSRGE